MTIRRPIVSVGGQFEQMPAGGQVPADVLPSNVSALAALIGAANKIAYFTGPGAMNLADFTVFARLWCALADAGAGRTLLELGTTATRDATTSATDTTSERLWRTNDLVKQTSLTDTTPGNIQLNGAHGNGGQIVATDTELDNYKTGGRYITPLAGVTNLPPGWVQARHVLDVSGGPNYTAQTIYGASANIGRKASRPFNGTTWQVWREEWNDGNLVKQTSTADTTAGRVLLNGAHGIGGQIISAEANLNNYLTGGKYVTPASGLSNIPLGWVQGRHIVEVSGGANYAMQIISGGGVNLGKVAIRTYGGVSFTDWQELEAGPKFVTARSATSYTFAAADGPNVYNRFTNVGASTCTIPPNSSVAFPVGHVIPIRRAAAANLTLTPGAGVTLNAPSGGTLVLTNNMTVELIKVATDTWDVVGQTVAV